MSSYSKVVIVFSDFVSEGFFLTLLACKLILNKFSIMMMLGRNQLFGFIATFPVDVFSFHFITI